VPNSRPRHWVSRRAARGNYPARIASSHPRRTGHVGVSTALTGALVFALRLKCRRRLLNNQRLTPTRWAIGIMGSLAVAPVVPVSRSRSTIDNDALCRSAIGSSSN